MWATDRYFAHRGRLRDLGICEKTCNNIVTTPQLHNVDFISRDAGILSHKGCGKRLPTQARLVPATGWQKKGSALRHCLSMAVLGLLLDIQIAHKLRILLDKESARLDIVTHQPFKSVVRE